jgi:hypothetical protein
MNENIWELLWLQRVKSIRGFCMNTILLAVARTSLALAKLENLDELS